MPAFACPGCDKKLSVKDDLAGRKARCPHCGSSMVVPAAAAAPAGDAPTAPPRASAADEAVTAPPEAPAAAGPRDTNSDAEATGGERPAAELTDFLGPSQGPEEIGRLGPYRILRILGAGGMGVVYQAEDPGLRRLVALKAMLPALAASATARERFLREARAAAAVEHDHIVAIYQVGEDRGVPYLAMPYLKGESLDARLKREKRVPVAEVLRIARETATGLEAARQRGLIHRDVKPANLWLEEGTGRVKILDFGLARSADEEGGLTQQGAILGTPAYMAPEQAGGPVDHRADLFSLGCVMYRMATSQPPFKGTDAISTLMAVATEEPRPPREIEPRLPPALAELILRLLAKRPEARPASAQAVVEAIRGVETALRTRPAARRRPTPPPPPSDGTTLDDIELVPDAPPPPPPRRRGRAVVWIGSFAAVLLLGGLAGGAYFALPHLRGIGGVNPGRPADAPPPAPEWQALFDGHNLSAWAPHRGRLESWAVENGVLSTTGVSPGGMERPFWLLTREEYGDFELKLDYRLAARARTAVVLRCPPPPTEPLMEGLVIPLVDDAYYKNLKYERTGSLYGLAEPEAHPAKPAREWNSLYVSLRGHKLAADINGAHALNVDLEGLASQAAVHPAVKRKTGRVGLQNHTERVEFRDIFVRLFPADAN